MPSLSEDLKNLVLEDVSVGQSGAVQKTTHPVSMHFRRAVAEPCTCSCWPSGSRRSVFLAVEDITLGECQPWKSPAKLQSKATLNSTPGAYSFTARLQATMLSLCQRLPACCFPQCFIVAVYSSARNVSATAFDREVGDHANLPLGPLALSSVQHATLTRLPCGRVSLLCEAVFRRGGWTMVTQF